ncbi:MAG TPA: hypothetical protein DCY74_10110 [Clostridiales bacterium]|jgi:hypothetical protein|nr:hypothetical protein [Clostridiales bacterium]HBE14511.1 hypothetical protein [Clostridiales bacterium]HCG35747.1 hypothetical protein [Clostridiales bacterium]
MQKSNEFLYMAFLALSYLYDNADTVLPQGNNRLSIKRWVNLRGKHPDFFIFKYERLTTSQKEETDEEPN